LLLLCVQPGKALDDSIWKKIGLFTTCYQHFKGIQRNVLKHRNLLDIFKDRGIV